MKNSKGFRLWPPIVVLALFTVLWISTLWVVPIAARWLLGDASPIRPVPDEQRIDRILATSGQVGDMFGVANALFSGLALAGVALTVWLQVKDRQRESRPFLVPEFDMPSDTFMQGGWVRISHPTHKDGQVVFPCDITVTVNNISGDAALNVSVLASMFDRKVLFSGNVEIPVSPGALRQITLVSSLEGEYAKRLEEKLTRNGGVVELSLGIEYDNVNKVRWRTAVVYLLSLDVLSRDRDTALLKEAVDGSSVRRPGNADNAPDVWTAQTTISLQLTPKAGSWRHDEL